MENPGFFNGRVLLMERMSLTGGVLEADFMESRFADFLFWKDQGLPAAGAIDGFGSALIRARGGEVLLARQRAGNVNGGLIYMPGGFIDPRDVTVEGCIDIDASFGRELEEETGLAPSAFKRRPGYLVTVMPGQVSIAIEFVSDLEAAELRTLLLESIARQAAPELEDFVIYSAPPAIEDSEVMAFSRRALAAVL
ncbi:MAG: NUDIX hydrolase [Alphaproteobacteria bacterium]|nr:NUDIX hydrolase [Alphaproteobacteria bacterium]